MSSETSPGTTWVGRDEIAQPATPEEFIVAKDPGVALEWLTEYLERLAEYRRLPAGQLGVRVGPRASALYDWLQSHQDRVKVVAEDLVPDQVWCLVGFGNAWFAEEAGHIRRAVGTLGHSADLAEHWSGEPGIEFDPQRIHPWVWNAAKDLWESRHWGEAVEAAVKVVNVKLQERVGSREASGTDLVRRAFSVNPPRADETRLRVMEDDGSDTYASAQEGAMHLGEAVFMYWRNTLAHEPGGADRQSAVEGLGAISTFARLVDEADTLDSD
jgi:uncharacterized protein (TIGR02391 family)